MESQLYKGSHQQLFEEFLKLVDDSGNHIAALLELVSWKNIHSLLSIGGGRGTVEATILRNAPKAKVWYLDPSYEQCQIFRKYMSQENLQDRVEDVAQSTFQDYNSRIKFDRVLSMFSWYFIGTKKRQLTKLLDLLTPSGIACIVLPNTESIFADFTRSLSPDKHMTLVGDEVVKALDTLECNVTQHTYTKWLSINELFEGDVISDASLAFAAFIAMRQIAEFTVTEKKHIANMLNARREEKGVPLMWDVIVVKPK